ncbi:AFG1-like ATPase-domain-containing protein [Polychytrium aggregatum]|uniref:AFG1-like ATPase-domain-containing protein n=1 Tax=Polychytrium aggregatum TaxID=110093 RepID=UPI0022FEF3B1|nr:AFG1-like ATPase-domain-containing protein [Polychytrium aggregatum]KAI9207660.1 AFG1-like ATPase-domain-containing protein [Polychytrium aggregatum]
MNPTAGLRQLVRCVERCDRVPVRLVHYTSRSQLPRENPVERYRELALGHQFYLDRQQVAAVGKIKSLWHRLEEYNSALASQSDPSPPIDPYSASPLTTSSPRSTRASAADAPGRPTSIPRGLWIHGRVGSGKTMLMDLLCESVGVEKKIRLHFDQLMAKIHSHMRDWHRLPISQRSGHVSHYVATQLHQEAWLLFVDEFQLPDVATASILGQCLLHSFAMGSVLVTTSNQTPRELGGRAFHQKSYRPLIHLLEQGCEIYHLGGEHDYRQLAGIGLDSYYDLSNPSRSREYNDYIQEMRSRHRFVPRSLEVYGRRTIVPETSARIAIFDFDYLCGDRIKPFGVADYLAIAHEFDVVVIERVPKMTVKQKDQVRRLIMLVDALYDNKVRIVMSAAGAPEELFRIEGFGATGPHVGPQISDSNSGKLRPASSIPEADLGTGADDTSAGKAEGVDFGRTISRIHELSGTPRPKQEAT